MEKQKKTRKRKWMKIAAVLFLFAASVFMMPQKAFAEENEVTLPTGDLKPVEPERDENGIDTCGESGEEFLIRIQAAAAAMIDYMAQNEIFEAAVVTHGGVIATLMSTLGLPRQPLQFWKTSGGRGFTCFVHPQIWQNDHLMEVAGILPHGATTACETGNENKG